MKDFTIIYKNRDRIYNALYRNLFFYENSKGNYVVSAIAYVFYIKINPLIFLSEKE